MKLLLDEHFRPQIARLLRERGHDVVVVVERPELVGMPDSHVWEVAIAEARAVATENARDFVPAARATNSSGASHQGLVLISPRTVNRSRDASGQIAEGLERIILANPGDSFVDRVAWIDPPVGVAEGS